MPEAFPGNRLTSLQVLKSTSLPVYQSTRLPTDFVGWSPKSDRTKEGPPFHQFPNSPLPRFSASPHFHIDPSTHWHIHSIQPQRAQRRRKVFCVFIDFMIWWFFDFLKYQFNSLPFYTFPYLRTCPPKSGRTKEGLHFHTSTLPHFYASTLPPFSTSTHLPIDTSTHFLS